MGVKHLNKIIKKYHMIEPTNLSNYAGKTIVIDTSLFMHKFYSMQGELFKGMFHQIETLLKYGISCLFRTTKTDSCAAAEKSLEFKL